MYARVHTAVLNGIDGIVTGVEADLHNGMPTFHIVGLPDMSVREAKERIHAAVCNSGCHFPAKRITVNLSPADLKKEGTHLDLPIAVSVLAAMGEINSISGRLAFLGELSLNGRIKRINGVVPLLMGLIQGGIRYAVIPWGNMEECRIVKGIKLSGAEDLKMLIQSLQTGKLNFADCYNKSESKIIARTMDFSEVHGQELAKRVIEIGAAGRHHMLLMGPPGSGKTMLAERIPTILPEMTEAEKLEATKIYSTAGLLTEKNPILKERPFRQPHHSATAASLTGGGAKPRPGELSLAHGGVLFLDEIPEFSRNALEILRQPLEQGLVHLSRAGGSITYPASFILVAAMNPCPCGYWGQAAKNCTCTELQVRRYHGKLSGPLLDRIDLQAAVEPVTYEQMEKREIGLWEEEGGTELPMSSQLMAARVLEAAERQKKRYHRETITCNGELSARQLEQYCQLQPDAAALLKEAFGKNIFSMRGYHKVIKTARTIADLDGADVIQSEHVAEAIGYRCRAEIERG